MFDFFGGGDNGMGDYADALRKNAQEMDAIAKQFGLESGEKLKEYLAKAEGRISPYETAGRDAMGDFGKLSREMVAPGFIDTMMQGYSTSPWAKHLLNTGNESINSAAYARGLGGSTAQGRNLMQYGQDITSKDIQQYLGNKLGARAQGMGGLENMMRQGYGAAGTMGGWNMDTGSNFLRMLAEQLNARKDSISMRNQAAGADAASKQSKGSFLSSLIPTAASMFTGGGGGGLFGFLGGGGGGGSSAPAMPAWLEKEFNNPRNW